MMDDECMDFNHGQAVVTNERGAAVVMSGSGAAVANVLARLNLGEFLTNEVKMNSNREDPNFVIM